jgi:hypothetical protein
MFGAQRVVYLNVDVHPIAVACPLDATTLPDTQFRATQRTLQISKRTFGL